MRDTTPTSSVLIDARDLARILAISVPSVWRWREAGKLPPAIALTSQCIRWRRDAVLAWIEAGCPAATASESQKGKKPE